MTLFPFFFSISDKTKPQVEFLPNQPKISDSDITLHWRTKTNIRSSFGCSLDNPNDMKPCGVGKTGSWTGRNIPDGKHTLYVHGIDSFGNAGDVKTHNWRVGKSCFKIFREIFYLISIFLKIEL